MATLDLMTLHNKLAIILGEETITKQKVMRSGRIRGFDQKREHAYQWSRIAHPEWITGNGGWIETFVQTFADLQNAFESFIIFDNRTQAIFLPDFYKANPDWADAPVEWVIATLSNSK